MESLYIKEILAGNVSRFSYFINTYKDMAFSIAFRICGNREDAEEIVQDAFLKVYQSLQMFRHDAKFSTWLYKIVVNTSLSRRRKRKMFSDDIDDLDLSDRFVSEIDGAYKSLSALEQKRFIDAVLEELPADDSLMLTLFYLSENSIDEIHEVTGVSTDNIKMKIHRARKKMYVALEKKLKSEIHSLL